MSTSNLSNRWLNRIYKVIAICLVTFAVLISAMRLLLPYAQHYRLDLQDHINQRYQTDVKIGYLTMDWLKFGPVLVAEHVDLINSDSVKVSIGRLNIEVDFWRSVRQQKLTTNNITIDDAYVYVDKAKLLESSQNDTDQLASIKNISDLFLSQISRFSLSNSHLTLNEAGENKEFTISHLNWLNGDNRHQASGDVILKAVTKDKLKLLIDLQGSQFEKLAGQIYLQANSLNITPWLDTVLKVEKENIKSDINFNAWATITKGRAAKLQVNFSPSVLQWSSNEQDKSFSLNQGSLLFRKINEQSYDLQSSPILLSVDEEPLKQISIDALFDLQQGSSLYVSNVDVGVVANILPVVTDNNSTLTLLSKLKPTGEIENIYWRTIKDIHQASVSFKDISIGYADGIPGISNVTGDIVLNDSQFFGHVASSDSTLDFGKHFKQPIAFNRLAVTFEGAFDEAGLIVNTPLVSFESNTLEASAEIGVAISNGLAPNMSLLAQVHRADVVQANQFYPHLLMGQNLVDYLNAALISGRVEQAQVLFNGPLSAFPFAEQEGIFVVDAELSKARFEFDQAWPEITSLSANLNFTNNSMFITARDGRLSGLDVKGVTASIDDLGKEQLLVVKAGIDKQLPENITTLMQASPLRDSVGETLTRLTIREPVSGSFKLELPLNDLESSIASGLIKFDDNQLELQAPQMQFTKVNGELTFINDVLAAESIVLDWLGMPLIVNVAGQDQSNHYQTDILISGDWQQDTWQGFVPDNLKKYAAGELNWQGELSLYNHHNSGFSYDLAINSDLNNLSFELPEPYRKEASSSAILTAKAYGREQQSTLNLTLDEHLSFYGVLNHDNAHFTQAHLVLGNEQMLLPMNGFHITTKLEQAQFEQWQPLVTDIIDSIPEESAAADSFIESPERIRGTIANFNVLGQDFHNVSFNLLDQDNWWLLRVNAKEVRSQIKFYPDWLRQGVDVKADFITLVTEEQKSSDDVQTDSDLPEDASIQERSAYISPESAVSDKELLTLFENIPTIKFQCDSCQVDNVDFGEVRFAVDRPEENKLTLSNFNAQRSKASLSMDGSWQYDAQGQSLTSIKGKLLSKDVEQEVEKLGFASIIKDSGLESEFDFRWQGGPHQFNVPKLNGEIRLELDDGYLDDVSDSGARILSILSLQSLLRKLTLDFRDIFSDGMFYSSIKGDMQVKNGVLYTDNTLMNGAAGDLSIKGNTNLNSGLLDYRMSYKPNLTSSLPVLAWIATLNPVVFLTGIAIDEVITSQVVSEFNFELTGAVEDPQLKEVNRKTRDVSVGRTEPPKFVENTTVTDGDTNSSPTKQDKPPASKDEDKQDESNG